MARRDRRAVLRTRHVSVSRSLCALACFAVLASRSSGFRQAIVAQFFATQHSSLTAIATTTNGDLGRIIRHAARIHRDLANNSPRSAPADLFQVEVQA